MDGTTRSEATSGRHQVRPPYSAFSEGRTPGRTAGSSAQPAVLALHRAESDQGTGMLAEHLGTSIANAFVRLRAYAYVNDLRLTDVARNIVARRLRLRPDPGSSQDGDV